MTVSKCHVRVVGSAELVTVTPGLVTKAMIRQTRESRPQLRATLSLCDFRRAAWMVTADDLGDYFFGGPPASELPGIGAYVVSDAHVRLFKAHTMDLAHAGILRKVFTAPAPAQAWLLEQAALRRLARGFHPGQTAPPRQTDALDLSGL